MLLSILVGYNFVRQRVEGRLMDKEIRVIENVHQSEALRFSEWLKQARESVTRFAEAISGIDKNPSGLRENDFNQLVSRLPDGTYRSRRDDFNPAKESGIWIQRNHPLDSEQKKFFASAKYTTDLFGQGLLIGTMNTWLLPKEGGIVIFWPSQPEWIYTAEPELDYTGTEWMTLTWPERNPAGEPRWTPTSMDPAPSVWMISIVAPFTRNGTWGGSVGHDIPITNIASRIDHLKLFNNTVTLLSKQDGTIIYSSRQWREIADSEGSFSVRDIDEPGLAAHIGELISNYSKNNQLKLTDSISKGDKLISSVVIPETDWVLTSIIPAGEIANSIRTTYRYFWILISVMTIIVSLVPVILFALIVLPYIKTVNEGTNLAIQGNYDYIFKKYRIKEFNQLSFALNNILAKIRLDLEEQKESQETVEELNRKLRGALSEAENSDRIKTEFLANISHEIRTPLNSILGFTDIIESQTTKYLDEESQKFFDIIRLSSKRLMNTVHDILDISQIEAGTVPFNPQPTRLATTAEWVYKEYRLDAEEKNLAFNFDNQIGGGRAVVDQPLIMTAITNLVKNAIKYTEKGEINLVLKGCSGGFCLEISDTGIGIDPDYMDHLYDVFSQQSTGYTKKYQGLGLGLTISKRYLDLNEVPIEVESKQGEGTTFRLKFNAIDEIDEELESPASKQDINNSTPKTKKEKAMILIVEDDVNNRRTLEVILQKIYSISCAVSVQEAKVILNDIDVDLVLLDLSLEGNEDGLDLVSFMKGHQKFNDIPIIAVTAHAFPADRKNVMDAGCDDYFSKPIDIRNLTNRIKDLLVIEGE